ncbi:glycosyltransferase family 4 protein [Algoriphagus aestuariicola]|uniref:Glycosyltransferase family 4 protein n=1 Tax=Algoriphagus aestuariicola TaxID=1852016 RepID=A0ABS3BLL5_9BACT|nr:glycosyltransferase family 4 protein [Algoriphagus aestuariicola]MBN7800178.1 glycosyltransferase family 4 protein [Algoriphagus aestuariicola]
MKPEKIAFLLNEFPTLTETFILNQIIFLIRQGVDVRIFALYPGDFDRLHHQYHGYGLEHRLTTVAVLPKSYSGRLAEAWRFFRSNGFLRTLPGFLKSINPFNFGSSGLKLTHFLHFTRLSTIESCELIHVHFGQVGVFLSAFTEIGLLNSIPIIVSFHGYDLVPNQYLINRKLYRPMFRVAKALTVNSQYTGNLLNQVNPEVKSKVWLLPESLDTKLFDRSKDEVSRVSDRNFHLVFIGRLVDWKGPDTAVMVMRHIVKEIRFSNVRLTVIGKGPMDFQLKAMVQNLGLSEYVKLLGGQEQSVVRSVLASADLFVYTGREQKDTKRAENQGLVLMEAQAMGIPVVAFDVGGVGEGVKDGVTGYLLPPGSVHEFAYQIVNLLRNEERLKEMGHASKSYVKKNYDIDVLGERLLSLYKQVVV